MGTRQIHNRPSVVKDYNGDSIQQFDRVIFPLELGRLAVGIVLDDLDDTKRDYLTLRSTKDECTTTLVPPSSVIKVPR